MTVLVAGRVCSDASGCCGAMHERESRTLAAIRDALLHKLISGELRVKDAFRLTQETLRC